MRLAALLLAFCLPAAAPAQEVDPAIVTDCLAHALPGEVAPRCLGAAANACQAAGHETTLGISACIQAETAAWDAHLNDQYRALRAELAAQEPDLTTALRDAQRAWIAFRDAQCALDYARWQGGSIRTIVAANCMMTMTAQRTIELRDMKGN